jgi:hypothetical protein
MSLKKSLCNGSSVVTEEELDHLVDFLLGIRRKLLAKLQAPDGSPLPLPKAAVSAYRKLLQKGLFTEEAKLG